MHVIRKTLITLFIIIYGMKYSKKGNFTIIKLCMVLYPPIINSKVKILNIEDKTLMNIVIVSS